MIIIVSSAEWSVTYPFVIPLNFSPTVTSSPYWRQFILIMMMAFGDAYVESSVIFILDAEFEQATIHDVTFNQNTFYWISNQQSDLFNVLSKHQHYLMAPLESIITKRFILNSNHHAYPVHHLHCQTLNETGSHDWTQCPWTMWGLWMGVPHSCSMEMLVTWHWHITNCLSCQ